eukprot:m.367627 g.367627  ORF g.367627 m.367627 type:complete len:88 (-) comp19975_c1_seq53:3045-3308(-)
MAPITPPPQADFAGDETTTSSHVRWIRNKVTQLLAEVRPRAVGLVDAFNFSDHFLGSCLGRFDGHVYEALWQAVQHNPLNGNWSARL